MEAKNGKMSVLYSVFVITKYTWRNMKYPSYFMLRKKREECYNCFWAKYSVLKIKFFTFKIRIFYRFPVPHCVHCELSVCEHWLLSSFSKISDTKALHFQKPWFQNSLQIREDPRIL